MWAVLRLRRLRLRLSVCESRQTAAANVTTTRDHAGPPPRVELLWFDECPNHAAARGLLSDALGELAPGTVIDDIDATDPAVALLHRFPGSPTIRINGGTSIRPSAIPRFTPPAAVSIGRPTAFVDYPSAPGSTRRCE